MFSSFEFIRTHTLFSKTYYNAQLTKNLTVLMF